MLVYKFCVTLVLLVPCTIRTQAELLFSFSKSDINIPSRHATTRLSTAGGPTKEFRERLDRNLTLGERDQLYLLIRHHVRFRGRIRPAPTGYSSHDVKVSRIRFSSTSFGCHFVSNRISCFARHGQQLQGGQSTQCNCHHRARRQSRRTSIGAMAAGNATL